MKFHWYKKGWTVGTGEYIFQVYSDRLMTYIATLLEGKHLFECNMDTFDTALLKSIIDAKSNFEGTYMSVLPQFLETFLEAMANSEITGYSGSVVMYDNVIRLVGESGQYIRVEATDAKLLFAICDSTAKEEIAVYAIDASLMKIDLLIHPLMFPTIGVYNTALLDTTLGMEAKSINCVSLITPNFIQSTFDISAESEIESIITTPALLSPYLESVLVNNIQYNAGTANEIISLIATSAMSNITLTVKLNVIIYAIFDFIAKNMITVDEIDPKIIRAIYDIIVQSKIDLSPITPILLSSIFNTNSAIKVSGIAQNTAIIISLFSFQSMMMCNVSKVNPVLLETLFRFTSYSNIMAYNHGTNEIVINFNSLVKQSITMSADVRAELIVNLISNVRNRIKCNSGIAKDIKGNLLVDVLQTINIFSSRIIDNFYIDDVITAKFISKYNSGNIKEIYIDDIIPSKIKLSAFSGYSKSISIILSTSVKNRIQLYSGIKRYAIKTNLLSNANQIYTYNSNQTKDIKLLLNTNTLQEINQISYSTNDLIVFLPISAKTNVVAIESDLHDIAILMDTEVKTSIDGKRCVLRQFSQTNTFEDYSNLFELFYVEV